MKRTLKAHLAVLVVAGLLVGSQALAAQSATSAGGRYAGVPKGHWVVGFCNGMTGNAWRAAHVDAWEQECKLAEQAGLVSKHYTANVDGANAQVAAINDFISKGVNLICIEADSGPALGPVIQDALDKGITVVSTDPCGLTVKEGGKLIIVNGDNDEYMRAPMEYLAYRMNYKGSVIHLYGLEGGWAGGEVRKAVVREVVAKNPSMKIVAGVACNWLNTKANAAITSLLSTHGAAYGGPGVLVAAEDVGTGIIQAYESAKVPLPCILGDYTYGFLRACAKYKDLVSCSNVYPPSTTRTYLYAGLLSLDGYKMNASKTLVGGVPNSITTPMPFIVVNENQIKGNEPWLKMLRPTTKVKLLKDVVAEADKNKLSDNATLDGWLTMQELIDLYYVK